MILGIRLLDLKITCNEDAASNCRTTDGRSRVLFWNGLDVFSLEILVRFADSLVPHTCTKLTLPYMVATVFTLQQ